MLIPTKFPLSRNLRTLQDYKRKREWCESHLSALPCKLDSGKTRRIGNMKEESTPYDGADSLKQIRVPSTFQFTRFQLTELFACSCPQDCLAYAS